MSQDLIVSIEKNVGYLTLNRPEARNALSEDIVTGLRNTLTTWERDSSVRAIVLKGSGDHFMSGGDVKRFSTMAAMPPAERRALFEQRIHNLHPVLFLMRRIKKPIIASIQGAAAGAGMSFMMACDMVIAADTAFFTLAYVNIGTSPDGGGTYLLPRTVGMKKAMEIAMLGDRFDANTAEKWGLVNFVVPAAQLAEETRKLAERLASGPTHAIGNTKTLINSSINNSMESQLQAEAMSFADCASTRDWAEGVTAFAEKRKPMFKGE
jgi:2-(1,2-epoxy-1,2-dihydrophenyl)acetyl-CoA isomerase